MQQSFHVVAFFVTKSCVRRKKAVPLQQILKFTTWWSTKW